MWKVRQERAQQFVNAAFFSGFLEQPLTWLRSTFLFKPRCNVQSTLYNGATALEERVYS